MGQYYQIVNLDKKQYLNPHRFGDGLKLMEFGDSGGATLLALTVLLADGNGRGGGDFSPMVDREVVEHYLIGSWAGDRIVITGDYADQGKFTDNPSINLYQSLDEYEDISDEVRSLLALDMHLREEDCIKRWASFGTGEEVIRTGVEKMKASIREQRAVSQIPLEPDDDSAV